MKRSNSRLSEAIHVPWDTRFPVILPRKHRVTFLVVRDLHVQSGHGGTSMVMTRVTAQFWIPALRELVREVRTNCMMYNKLDAKPAGQAMAPLPSHRMTATYRAFAVTALDFAGPFRTKQG